MIADRIWPNQENMRQLRSMAGLSSPLTPLIKDNPANAKQKLLATLLSCNGNVAEMARRLRISRRSAHRYIAQLELSTELEQIREGRV